MKRKVLFKFRLNGKYKQRTVEFGIPTDEHGWILMGSLCKKVQKYIDDNFYDGKLMWVQIQY